MTRPTLAKWRTLACALAVVATVLAASACGGTDVEPVAPASAEEATEAAENPNSPGAPIAPLSIESVVLDDGVELEFVIVLPPGYRKGGTYPTMVALPPGDQARGITENVVQQFFFTQARERGWVVISPIAPKGRLFFDGSHRLIPPLLAELESRFRPEGDRYHLLGLSNGGVSAFNLAIARPALFHSLIVFPGFPRGLKDPSRLERLRNTPVRMIVGQLDEGWVEPMREIDSQLRDIGADVTLQVEPGEGHFIGTVDGDRLLDALQQLRPEDQSDEDAVVVS